MGRGTAPPVGAISSEYEHEHEYEYADGRRL